MSKYTGVRDFKDFVTDEDPSYLKKLNIYIGYMNYLYDNPIDTKNFNSPKDWAPYYHYTITSRSLYRALGEGYVILSDRDYISIQEDKLGSGGYTETIKKLQDCRVNYYNCLLSLGYTEEEALSLAKYQFELKKGELDLVEEEEEGDTNGRGEDLHEE